MVVVERVCGMLEQDIGLYSRADVARLRVSDDRGKRYAPNAERRVPGIGLAHGQKP